MWETLSCTDDDDEEEVKMEVGETGKKEDTGKKEVPNAKNKQSSLMGFFKKG